MFTKIVVGVDGSTGSRAALQWAADEALRHNARLVVVMAWKFPWTAYVPFTTGGIPTAEAMQDATNVALAQLVTEELGDDTGITIECKAPWATPAHALLDEQEPGTLLVLSLRDRSFLQEVVFGSTTRTTIDKARCPIAVLPEPSVPEPAAMLASSEHHGVSARVG